MKLHHLAHRVLPKTTRTSIFGAVACALLAPLANAQPERPGWESLPESTIFCLRMPNTAAFIEQVREQSVLGQQVLTPERFEGFKQLLIEENSAEWQEFEDELAEVGFTFEDLLEMSQQPWGLAIVTEPRDHDQPRWIMLAWADLNDEQIDQIFDSQEREMEAAEEAAEHPIVRVDLELAGLPVRQLSSPEIDWIEGDDGEWEEAVTDQTHVLMTRVPGRMIIAVGFPQSGDRISELLEQGEEIDWEVATDVESVHAVLTRYLQDSQGEAGGGFAARVLSNADAAAAVPRKGDSLFEAYGDVSAFFEMVRDTAVEDGMEPEQYDQVMDGLGLNSLGLMAASYYLDNEALIARFWVEASQPRRGLPGTLDGATLPAAPPDWVTTDLRYGHLAYDLGTLYDVIVELATSIGGEEAAMQLQMANGMTQAQTQTDIPGLLRSLGIAHHFVLMPTRTLTMEVEEWDDQAEDFVMVEREVPAQPMAFVWELQDPDVWQRAMNAIIGFSAMAGDEVQVAEEQGFRGLRMDTTGIPMSLMLGPNHLVMGIGPDATARVLSLLNSPPPPADRLANADLADDARAILGDSLQPGFFFQIEDSGKSMLEAKRELLSALDEFTGGDAQLAERIKALLPTDEEMTSSLGVSVGVGTVTESGIRIDAAVGLPAP